ncbi:MAG: hypothetical protein RSD35_08625 [Oscillospiraceae bacterium]
MKKLYEKLKNMDISARSFWVLAMIFVALRLGLVSFQTLTLYPETSMLDDMLMYKSAQSILAGNWLGSYNYLTLGKHMLFPLWLALIHKLGISYLLAGQLLYISSSLALVLCFSPVLKNRLLRLAFFVFIAFSPASFANFTLRVYRDNITVAFIMLVFAGFIGFALRLNAAKTGVLWVYGIISGFALGCSWLLREDGYWLLPFCVVAAVVIVIFIIREKPEKPLLRLAALASSFAVFSICILGFCAANYSYYGRFIISDFTSSEFKDAYGAITRVVPDKEDYNPIVPLPYSSREKLYKTSPLFAELEPYLESDDFTRWQKDCGDGKLDYSGGGLYWAIRNAASLAGYYETPEIARNFYLDLAAEINEACDSGVFESVQKRSALNSPITTARIIPVLKESVRSLATVVTYSKIDNSPEISTGSELIIDELENFVNCGAKRTVKVENGNKRIVVWAFSENSYVDICLTDIDGNTVASDINVSTASDVYLDQIYGGGKDLRYTGACRRTIVYDSSEDDRYLLLSSNDGKLMVAASVTAGAKSDNGITYFVEYAGSDYDESVEFGFAEIWLYRGMRVLVRIYGILNTLFFISASWLFIFAFIKCVRKRTFTNRISMLFLIALSLLLMSAFRIGMISFAETSAFGIGTFPMYLAAVYPLLITYQFLSVIIFKSVKDRS